MLREMDMDRHHRGFPAPFEQGAGTITDESIGVSRDTLSGWNVLLWNDDVHSMDYVVLALVKTIGMPVELAVDVMLEAHENGKAVAWSGAKEVAETYRDGLEGYGLTATLSK